MSGLLPSLAGPGDRSNIASGNEFTVSDEYQDIKFRIFGVVLEQLEVRGLAGDKLDPRQLAEEIGDALTFVVARDGAALNAQERSVLIQDVRHEISGLGPLEPLLKDPTIDDVIVNGPLRVYIERGGRLSRISVRFRDDQHLMTIIQRIVGPIGRRVDEGMPYVDARLADGSRVNIIIPPVALDGPTLSIRKFRAQAMTGHDYVLAGSMDRDMLAFLASAVRSRLNILICGGTGSGKTTLLNMLSSYIGENERLITIEDAAELQLRQTHVVRLETRPSSLEDMREVSARDLVRNALRMRPDRIILGEVRGPEALEMLQAMNTGHDGSMATMHASTSRDAFGRLEILLGFAGLSGDPKTVRRYIASSIQLLVQVNRMANGKRRITSIAEVTGLEGDAYTLNQLFAFEESPPMSGKGEFVAVSRRPFFAQRLVQVADLRKPSSAA